MFSFHLLYLSCPAPFLYKDYGKAEACCMRLLDYAGPEKQLAKALLREIHALQEAAAERAEDTSMADV